MSVKKLKSELLVVVRDLRKLSQKIDRMAKRVAKIEKSQKPKRKVGTKSKKRKVTKKQGESKETNKEMKNRS